MHRETLALGLSLLVGAPAGAASLEDAWPRVQGVHGGDQAGVSVAVADLDGDGIDDLVVGADRCDHAAEDGGCVALFFGGGWPWPALPTLDAADAVIVGTVPGERLGAALSAGGDLDDDGYLDLAIAAPDYPDGGRVVVFFGGGGLAGPWLQADDADVIVTTAHGATGLGDCLDGRRDLDGDGFDDLVVGTGAALEPGGDAVGMICVLHGSGSWPSSQVLNVQGGECMVGDADDSGYGATCAAVQDQDGDGAADLLVGAPWREVDGWLMAGEVVLLSGGEIVPHGDPLDAVLSSWAGTADLAMVGGAVADPGDMDGDGAGDLAFAAAGAAATAGEVYLWFNDGQGEWGYEVDPSVAPLRLQGETVGGQAGATIAGAGDLDGDGAHELLIAAPHLDLGAPDAGRIYRVDGGGDLVGAALSLADADAWWDGAAGMRAGDAVAAGDVGGWGWPSIAVGAVRGGDMALPEGSVVLLSAPDGDGDGFCAGAVCEPGLVPGDCDDRDPTAWPGAVEVPYDGVDSDCDGFDPADLDGDGEAAVEAGGADCDDGDAMVFPGAADQACDGVDADCDGIDPSDGDGDGHDGSSCGGQDCDDEDPTCYPGAVEVPDGADNDCDGVTDEGTELTDDDGDGYCESEEPCSDGAASGDCDDADPLTWPGADERADGVDNDCDGLADEDTVASDDDLDGLSELDGDCDDGDPTVHPGAEEVPANGVDDDCDGDVDEESEAAPGDGDGDGYCPAAWICGDGSAPGDCDDGDPSIHPGAPEVPYDDVDQDCDGMDLVDVDGDGYVATQAGGTDCDDGDADVHPGRLDLADDVDTDCDGVVDEDAGGLPGDIGGGCSTAAAHSGRGRPAGGLAALLLIATATVLQRRR